MLAFWVTLPQSGLVPFLPPGTKRGSALFQIVSHPDGWVGGRGIWQLAAEEGCRASRFHPFDLSPWRKEAAYTQISRDVPTLQRSASGLTHRSLTGVCWNTFRLVHKARNSLIYKSHWPGVMQSPNKTFSPVSTLGFSTACYKFGFLSFLILGTKKLLINLFQHHSLGHQYWLWIFTVLQPCVSLTNIIIAYF